MNMKSSFRPSALVSELLFPYLGTRGVVGDAVARIADEGFYEGVEIATVDDAGERRCIGSIVGAHELSINCWASLVLADDGLNLSSTDATVRKRTVARLEQLMEEAAEMGTAGFGINSGPDPGPAARDDALESLFESVCALSETAATYAPMFVLFEALDRGVDKNGLIGPTAECVRFIQRVRAEGGTSQIAWDTSHTALCGEDLCTSLAACRDLVYEIHLANPVTEASSPLHGDTHQPFGPPGLLDAPDLAEVLAAAAELGLFEKRRTFMAAEIRTPGGGDPWETEARGRQTLESAWGLYRVHAGHDSASP